MNSITIIIFTITTTIIQYVQLDLETMTISVIPKTLVTNGYGNIMRDTSGHTQVTYNTHAY